MDLSSSEFSYSGEPQINLQEIKKINKFQDFARELQKPNN